MFAAQMKQELKYGKPKVPIELEAKQYDDEEEEYGSYEEGEVPGYIDSEDEPIEQVRLK